jgi:hypothetical protein
MGRKGKERAYITEEELQLLIFLFRIPVTPISKRGSKNHIFYVRTSKLFSVSPMYSASVSSNVRVRITKQLNEGLDIFVYIRYHDIKNKLQTTLLLDTKKMWIYTSTPTYAFMA